MYLMKANDKWERAGNKLIMAYGATVASAWKHDNSFLIFFLIKLKN
jgi:hypothetical protein